MFKKFNTEISSKNRHILYIAGTIILVIALIGIGMRVVSFNKLKNQTKDQAVPIVSTIKANLDSGIEEIILPGNVQAWHEATIYARTNGYIKKWLVDIGIKVKKGELLAIIETPEVDAQLRQAQADLKTAIANYELAKSTAIRWTTLLKTDSVSKQETDEKVSAEKSLNAIVNSTKANRDRLQDLVSFNRIVAPFDGVITSRTTDIGSLIDAGSNAPVPLFHIVQSNRLRVYVNVPQNYSSKIVPKMIVDLEFAEHPGKNFPAKLIQTAKAINPTTRTLLSEFEVNNDQYILMPGSYTQVHLKLPKDKNNIKLPVNTLLFRAEGLQVATLPSDGKVVLKSVTIARDFGNVVEINSGIKAGDVIIINPPDSLETGQVVHVATDKETKSKNNKTTPNKEGVKQS